MGSDGSVWTRLCPGIEGLAFDDSILEKITLFLVVSCPDRMSWSGSIDTPTGKSTDSLSSSEESVGLQTQLISLTGLKFDLVTASSIVLMFVAEDLAVSYILRIVSADEGKHASSAFLLRHNF